MSYTTDAEEIFRSKLVRLSALPADTLYAFIRAKLGFDTMSLAVVLLLYCSLNGLGFTALFYSGLFNLVRTHTNSWSVFFVDPWLLIYAQVFGVVGFIIHLRRYREIKRGNYWYSYSEGTPRLQKLFPNLPYKTIVRVVEPAVCAIGSIVVFIVLSKILGLWLLWSSICMAIHEAVIADMEFKKAIELQDQLILTNIEILNAKGLQDLSQPDFILRERMSADPKLHGGQEPSAPSTATYGLRQGGEGDILSQQLQRRLKRQRETQQVDNGESLEGDTGGMEPAA
jgi:hypothetical protein